MDFDAIVLGTGLSESIAAAALAKAGFKLVHVDHNQYYGGDEASLTIDELAEWADIRMKPDESEPGYLTHQRARYTSITRSQTIPAQSRQYSISLAPSIVPSVGPHIDSLIASGVSRYGQFKLLEKVAVYDRPGFVQSVPGSKEDVFKSKALSLLDKRRLMRFLMFAVTDFEGKKELEGKEQMPFLQFLRESFSLNDKAANAIAYALAFCATADEPTLPAMQRIRQYLRSGGRYGSSPFLVGHYGGLGETAQGFCRTSAVKGATYILGRRVLSVKPPPNGSPQDEKTSSGTAPSRYRVELEDFEEHLTASVLVSSPDYVPASLAAPGSSSQPIPCPVARCIAIIDKPLVFTPVDAPETTPDTEPEASDADEQPTEKPALPNYEVDTALLVFPPSCLEGGSSTSAAHVLVTGSSSMSAPPGKFIINISLPLPPSSPSPSSVEDLLRPYLDASLTLTAPPSAPAETSPVSPLFTVFYVHHPPSASPTSSDIIVTPPCTQLLPVIADAATQNAEAMFWQAVEKLKAAGVRRSVPAEEGLHDANEEKDSTQDLSNKGGHEEKDDLEDVDSFWPPLDALDDESLDEW